MCRPSVRKASTLFIIIFLAVSVPHVIAQTEVGYRLDKVLRAPRPGLEGWFGNSVAMDSNHVIVGEAFGDADTTRRAGRAYLFTMDGGLLRSLQSPSPRKEGNFGGEEYCNKLVAVSGDSCAVGETRAQGGGKAHLFRADGSIAASLGSAEPLRGNKEFGNSLAMTEGFLLVGSYNAGAFLYDASGILVASLKAEGGAVQDGFGMATAIRGDTIVVTQDHAVVAGVRDAGMAYIYDEHGELKYSIRTPDPVQPALFGVSAATSGDLVVIGAPEATVEGRSRAGLAYVFTASGKLLKVLSAPVPTLYFGVSVSVDESRIIVGASGTKVEGQNGAGQAFVFDRNGVCQATLQATKPSAGANFGWSVASEGSAIAVSAPGEEVDGKAAAGRVYLFAAP
jgi:hypothetical protein